MGMLFFLFLMSEPTGLPVAAGSPQMPSRSSRTWNARPSLRPHAPNAAAVFASPVATSEPMYMAPSMSAPVLREIMSR